MGKGKYEGGSVPHTFRLPEKHFKEAKKGIEDYLDRFRTDGFSEDVRLRPFVLPEDKRPAPSKKLLSELDKKKREFDKSLLHPDNLKGNEYFQKAMNMVQKSEIERWDPISDQELVKEKEFEFAKEFFVQEGEPVKRTGDSFRKTTLTGVVKYPCGCFFDSVAFRKAKDCDINEEDHKV